ncbi:hypothetical protein [Stenotrophomonas sp.]|uniref:hypothetical protein n=1 Tax=Stenotrophomonas sp. TaxID=69392 RepID=UPI0028973D0E|nr:hypothetical protein [Stenotrophomonas sp.]
MYVNLRETQSAILHPKPAGREPGEQRARPAHVATPAGTTPCVVPTRSAEQASENGIHEFAKD